jgi:urease accessory protein
MNPESSTFRDGAVMDRDRSPGRAPDAFRGRAALRRAAGWRALAACAAGLPAVAHAHHPLGGATPTTAWEGGLSGLAHPVLGVDHLAFLLAAALLVAWRSRVDASQALRLALVFSGAGALGALARSAGASLPGLEALVAATVIAAGTALLARGAPGGIALAACAAVAGTLHGLAFGETVLGAGPAPVVAYLAGLFVAQAGLLAMAFRAARGWSADAPGRALGAGRAAGAVSLAAGLASLAVTIA